MNEMPVIVSRVEFTKGASTKGVLGDILVCPVCGNEFSHVRTAYTRVGSDSGEARIYPNLQTVGQTPYRRSAVCVLVDGEGCGHSWEVVLQQHKGQTLVQLYAVDESAETRRK